jgi:hypothetical protein
VSLGAKDKFYKADLYFLYLSGCMFDGVYPEPFLPLYRDFFEMTQSELEAVFDKFANKKYLNKIEGRWKLAAEVK